MGAETKIQWCDHTFNPWRGCAKVAAGCANCYAEATSRRNPKTLGIWGPDGTRVVASEARWLEPMRWNEAAWKHAAWCQARTSSDPPRPRVFCASLADVFEDWGGQCSMSDGRPAVKVHEQGRFSHFAGCNLRGGNDAVRLSDVRRRLFGLIDATPNLDWLLLTKRPENIRRMWPYVPHTMLQEPYHQFSGFRRNIWLGTSVATQDDADRNIPLLLTYRDLCPVLFVSVEPLLEPIRLAVPWEGESERPTMQPDWVIVGGESGPHARPCQVDWVRSLVRQCQAAGMPVFVKQLGSQPIESDGVGFVRHMMLRDKKGGDPSEWPEDLRVREYPS